MGAPNASRSLTGQDELAPGIFTKMGGHRAACGFTLGLSEVGRLTEAFDRDDAAFGEDRLHAALRGSRSAAEACDGVLRAVHAFASGAAQSDDITLLVVKRNSNETEHGQQLG